MYSTLISVDQLRTLQASGQPLMVFDCSFDLMQPGRGPELYRQAHLPGAVYANLDQDLSAPHGAPDAAGHVLTDPSTSIDGPASGGRHPLPSRERFARWLSSVGFTNGMQAVVYDRNGNNYCGRLWWMLQWAGHEAVAVLDGGLGARQAAGQPVTTGDEAAHFQSNFVLGESLRRLVDAATVAQQLGRPGQTLVDARAPARFRGETEPLDPVAGHIPGALNRPFADNFGADGRFKPAHQLRQEFETLLAGRDPASVVAYCGSGVSATPNLLALEIAGLGRPALYAGSWSDWCSDPSRPFAQG